MSILIIFLGDVCIWSLMVKIGSLKIIASGGSKMGGKIHKPFLRNKYLGKLLCFFRIFHQIDWLKKKVVSEVKLLHILYYT